MRRILSWIIVIGILCMLTSCGDAVYESTKNTSEDTQTVSTETSATGGALLPEDDENKVYYSGMLAFTDSPTRIIFNKLSKLYYYNKFTEEIHTFCFDPVCRHNDYDCISLQFAMAGRFNASEGIRYSAYDNRFYVARGEKLCSFTFDGSDMKIEYSFGDAGNFEDEFQDIYDVGRISSLKLHGRYLYMLAYVGENERRSLVRYDIETKTIKELFHDENTNVGGFVLTEEALFVAMTGDHAGLYRMTLDGEDMTLFSENLSFDVDIFFDGETIYYLTASVKDTEHYIRNQVMSFSLKTSALEEILTVEDAEESITLLALTDDYVYYTVQEPVSIGFSNRTWSSATGNEVMNYHSRIYRFDRNSGETVTVYDDRTFEVRQIYFCGETVLLKGSRCSPDETNAQKNASVATATLNEDGTITDPLPFGNFYN